MADMRGNPEEGILEGVSRIYARKHQDRFAHLLSSSALEFKTAAEGTKVGEATVSAGFACRDYSRASIAPLPSCANTCPFCVKQFRPLSWQETIPALKYTLHHSDDEAASIIGKLVQETTENLARIRQAILKSGDAIAKRWQRRSAAKRAALLLAAMPNMRRRVGMLVFSDLQGVKLSTLKAQLSLPYLTIEALSEDPLSLLALLHHRSTHRIADFVLFDALQLQSSFSQGALEASYNPHCISMCGEDVDIGNLVFWNKQEAHRSQIIGYPLAKMILEAQNIMSTFLVDMLDTILQSPVKPASQGHGLWDSLCAEDFVKNSPDHTAPVPRRAGYRAAPAGCLSMLRTTLSSIKARHSANQSDTWLLQTDPACTRQTLASLERSGFRYSDDKKRDTMTPLLLSSISRQVGWYVLEEIAKAVLQDFELDDISTTSNPELKLRCATGLQTLEQTLKLEFRSSLVRTRVRSAQTGFSGHPFRPQAKLVKSPKVGNNMSCWALERMSAHDVPDLPIPEQYLALLEYDIASQKKHERFNETLYDYVSDLSTLDEAIMAIKYVRPTYDWAEKADMEAYFEQMPFLKDITYSDYVDDNYSSHRDVLWPPLKAFLSTPVPTGRAAWASLAAFDASHAALAAFWDVARAVRRELLVQSGCPPERVEVLAESISAGLSEDYAAQYQNERNMLLNEICRREAAGKKALRPSPSISSVLHSSDSVADQKTRNTTPPRSRVQSLSSPRPPPLSHGKLKIKTRPEIPVQELSDRADSAIATPIDDGKAATDLRISVCPTSMDIFRRMFVTYGKRTNSNLRWSEFVKAMNDAGFAATWSTGGSAVVFDDIRGSGAIRLHQPHPDPSINPILLRAYGKRMSRQFGWSFDTFVESV